MPAALTIEKINTKKKSQSKSKNELDANIIEERVFILKRLREMLITQREKFNNYFNLLVKEEEAILNEDTEKIEVHIQVEHSILKEISSLGKVIKPLEAMYKIKFPKEEKTIPKLKNSLNVLKEKVLARNEKNRNLLKQKIIFLRQEIKSIKKNYKSQSPYSKLGKPSIIDIKT